MRAVKNTFITLLPLSASHGLMHILAAALPALSLLVKEEFQLTNTAVGLLSFAFAAATGLGNMPAGLLSDRFGGLSLISFGFFSTSILSIFLLFAPDLLSVALIFIAIGLFLGLYHPAALSYIAQSVRLKRGKVFGFHETGASIGSAITPLIAGFICFYLSWRFVYPILAVPAIALALLILTIHHEKDKGGKDSPDVPKDAPAHPPAAKNTTNDIWVFLRQIMCTGSLRRVYIAECVFGFVFGGALTFIPIFLGEAKGLDPAFAVTVASVFTVGGALGKVVGGHFSDLIGEQKVMTLGFFLVTPLFFILSFIPSLWSIITLGLAGVIFPMVLTAVITSLSKEIEPSRTGIAFGLLMLAGFGFGAISRIILGVVSDSFGITTVFYPIVIATLVGGIASCISRNRSNVSRDRRAR
jgi:FSR family fosmidomycin resistance protein-like MFS transporter